MLKISELKNIIIGNGLKETTKQILILIISCKY